MKDSPVVRIWFVRIQNQYEKRWVNWFLEVYCPLWMAIPAVAGANLFQIVKENPQYTKFLLIFHYENRNGPVEIRSDPRFIDIQKDQETTWGGKVEVVWGIGYEQIAIFKNNLTIIPDGISTTDANAPRLVHLEGYDLSEEEQEKYDAWFNKWGAEVFIPLFLKSTGLREYTRYKLIDVPSTGLTAINIPKQSLEYPPYLSILTFENKKAFDDYEVSLELGAFKSAIQGQFPFGLHYRWYVQYQLVKSFRK